MQSSLSSSQDSQINCGGLSFSEILTVYPPGHPVLPSTDPVGFATSQQVSNALHQVREHDQLGRVLRLDVRLRQQKHNSSFPTRAHDLLESSRGAIQRQEWRGEERLGRTGSEPLAGAAALSSVSCVELGFLKDSLENSFSLEKKKRKTSGERTPLKNSNPSLQLIRWITG